MRSVFEKDKLNGINYSDWIRNLRIVFRVEKKEDVLDNLLSEESADDVSAAVKNVYKKVCDVNFEVSCFMFVCMEFELQMQFEINYEAYDMIVA
ncbi:hypothetical protein, partial [Amycolatopsis sp. cmx-4-83]|uniref:hypothetical protein n=1 Tax=Amycolatopsis sp. cmx-4-83 TaxID=2790940 RepID=UPI0039793917